MTTAPAPSKAPASIKVQGDVQGSIVYGDYNFVVNSNHGTIVYQAPRPHITRHPAKPLPPRPPLHFLDRASEVQQAASALVRQQPAALYGVEGVGKTTLLKKIANLPAEDRYPDGVVLVDGEWEAGAAGGLDSALQSVFEALFDSDPPLKVSLATARTYLGSVKALVVLDHLELPPNAWGKLPDLIPAGGLLWSLPRALGGQAAWEVPVRGLPPEESARLFLETAGYEDSGADSGTVQRICAQLEHLPLALVTLARWARDSNLTLSQMADRLLAQPSGAGKGLERAMAAILAALGEPERALFSLAAAGGGPTVDRAVLVEASGLEGAVAEAALDRLQELGLLQAHSPDLGMHPALKAFARQQLPAGEARLARLAEAILRYASARQDSPEVLRGQLGNLLGALEYALRAGRTGLAAVAARLAAPQLVLVGKWELWRSIFEQISRVTTESRNASLLGRALHELGTYRLATGDRAAAVSLLTQARDLRLRNGDQVGAAYSQHNLGVLLGPPPPGGQASGGGTRPPWLLYLAGALLGGMGLFALLALVGLGGALLLFRNGDGPPAATASPTASAEIVASTTTLTLSPQPSLTRTPAPTSTFTFTSEPSRTSTPTATATDTPTPTPTPTLTPTSTTTLTPTPTLTPLPVRIDVPAVIDASVFDQFDSNEGFSPTLHVGNYFDVDTGDIISRAYLQFDTTSLPAGAEILSATMLLYMQESFDRPDFLVTVYAVDEAWDEFKIIWADQPAFATEFSEAVVGIPAGYYEWDLTGLVQAWVSGERPNYGLVLTGEGPPGEYDHHEFASRENPVFPPVLAITYRPP